MTNSSTIFNVAEIVRDFINDEAKTLAISQGKMLSDEEFDQIVPNYLQVG